MKVVLASASPRRARLCRQMNLRITVDPSGVDEQIKEKHPETHVKILAERKGKDVSTRHSNCLVIAADTIVVLNDTILGKPKDTNDAASMLRLLSANTHQVYSGVFAAKLSKSGTIDKSFTFVKRTNVTFSALTETEIRLYVQGGSPLDKAGAYGIQDDTGSLFVEHIEGDYYNVVGFPMNAFYNALKAEMPNVFATLFLSKAEP